MCCAKEGVDKGIHLTHVLQCWELFQKRIVRGAGSFPGSFVPLISFNSLGCNRLRQCSKPLTEVMLTQFFYVTIWRP